MSTDNVVEDFEQAIPENIVTEIDTSGRWCLKDTQSDRVSKELFISPKIAARAIDNGLFTWTDELHE